MRAFIKRIFVFSLLLTCLGRVDCAEEIKPVRIDPAFERMRAEFIDPPKEYTQIPFWFWNDELTDEGILQQIAKMEEKGVHGFIPHARMGLSEKIGYMTDEWLRLVKVAVEEADRRGMTVHLYDEGMYPSGSAHGEVVKGRPDLASQGLSAVRKDVSGPNPNFNYSIELKEREKLVAAVLIQKGEKENLYLRKSARIVPPLDRGTLDIPEGDWTLFLFVLTPSGGVIRGVHWDEEDDQPNAPPAADLLNRETAERFIHFSYEKYYQALKPYFGKTVRAMFTDEPSFFAKRGKRGLQPWTGGFLEDINAYLGYDFTPYLPLLWAEAGDGIETTIRYDFQCALAHALNERYYKPLSDWCRNHNVALTGHPAGSGDMDPIRYFQLPGQDVVWRWVLPGKTSLEGENSTLGKSATSVAYQTKRPLVLNECYGAYGWQLTMDEMKWLADWLFVRGTNRLAPHAFYYSVQDKRIFERPPCVAWNNLWWDDYALFSIYTNRMSWLMTNIKPVTHVAILTRPGHTPWRVAKLLFEKQIDFHYLDVSYLDDVTIGKETITIGHGTYHALVLDDIGMLQSKTVERLTQMADSGVDIVAAGQPVSLHPLQGKQDSEILQRLTGNEHYRFVNEDNALITIIAGRIPFDLRCPYDVTTDLRSMHFIKEGAHFYLLTNEGDNLLQAFTILDQKTVPEIWNAETGETRVLEEASNRVDEFTIPLTLYPRQSTIVVFPPHAPVAEKKNVLLPSPFVKAFISDFPTDGWLLDVNDKIGRQPDLGSWTVYDYCKTFAGTGWYTARINVSQDLLDRYGKITLELGEVHEFAKVIVNGRICGTRLWKPFHFDVTNLIQPGDNDINIGVTNTRANELTKTQYPSGLFGPVRFYFENEKK